MINTCMSAEFRSKVERDGFGINIEPENVKELADAVEQLYQDHEGRIRMGIQARKVAQEQFDRPVSYEKIETMIRKLIEAGKCQRKQEK